MWWNTLRDECLAQIDSTVGFILRPLCGPIKISFQPGPLVPPSLGPAAIWYFATLVFFCVCGMKWSLLLLLLEVDSRGCTGLAREELKQGKLRSCSFFHVDWGFDYSDYCASGVLQGGFLTGPPKNCLSTGSHANWPRISRSVSSYKGILFFKNPAYGRQRISGPMRIVAPIQFGEVA